MKHLVIIFSLLTIGLLIGCNSSDPKNTHDSPESIPEGKEIKLDQIDDQLKSDEERADSVKRALGIE